MKKGAIFDVFRFRDGLDDCLEASNSDAFLDEDELDKLAIALTELAEDVHADAGLWRSLEAYHQEFFAICFRFCVNSTIPRWRHSPSAVFSFFFIACREFSAGSHRFPRASRVSSHRPFRKRVFLPDFRRTAAGVRRGGLPGQAQPARLGGETQARVAGNPFVSFPFCVQLLCAPAKIKPGEEIAITDDFLCEQCTEWSGLGVVDILAAALDLPDADRAVLRGRYERHAAFYRIESLDVRGSEVETLDAVNFINDQTYRVRVELEREDMRISIRPDGLWQPVQGM